MIMGTYEYEQKVTTVLSDDKTYEKLKKDSTQKYKRQLVSIIRKLKEDGKITEEQYKYLTAENVSRMYCTLKIHKRDNPLRPIVDYTGSIGYNVSTSLADLLALIVEKTSHHIKNTKHLANETASIMIEQDEMFLSHDVVSLFTNTPINKTLDIIKKQLEADTKLKLWTNLNVDNIMEQMKFIVTTIYFSFTISQQKFGTAMGSLVSPVIANLFINWLEQQAILTAPITCKPKLWKIYVDDVMEVVRKGCEQELTDISTA